MTSASIAGRRSCRECNVDRPSNDDSFPMDPSMLCDRERGVRPRLSPRRERACVRAASRAEVAARRTGSPMLVEQAALAFERWFGVAPDRPPCGRHVAPPACDRRAERLSTLSTRRARETVAAVAHRSSALASFRRAAAPSASDCSITASTDWSAAGVGRGCPCSRRRAATGADTRRTARSCRWCELLPPYVRAGAKRLLGGRAHRARRRARAQVRRMAPRRRATWASRMARLELAARRGRGASRARAGAAVGKARTRERGYNQSERSRDALANGWRIPVWNDVLDAHAAHRDTDAVDTRGATPQRFGRVSRAGVGAQTRSAARTSFVVDDVVTTAATLNACAAALCDGGARIVSFVTFGRAPALGDRW